VLPLPIDLLNKFKASKAIYEYCNNNLCISKDIESERKVKLLMKNQWNKDELNKYSENVEIMTNTTVVGMYEDGIITVLHNEDDYFKINSKAVVVCTGAFEKSLAFPNNDLPGIYGAGAVQTLMNVYGVKPGNKVLMVGAGNIGLIVSYQLMQAGVDVVAILDAAPKIGGYLVHASKIRRMGVPILTGYTVKEAMGNEYLEKAVICQLDDKFEQISGTEMEFDVDVMCISVGLTPLNELLAMRGCVGAYNSDLIDWIITIFMLLFGVNFTLHYLLLKGEWKTVLKNEELRLYGITVLISILIIFINVLPIYNYSIKEALTQSSFQVATIVTTTGYATTDFNVWPMLSKSILLMLMLFGACAGSTGGGIKFIRVLLLFKSIAYEIKHTVHPNSIGTIKVDGRKVDTGVMSSIMVFFFAYIATIIIAVLIVSLDNFDFMTTFSAVLATISNIGPGFEIVGPMGNYADFSVLSKMVLTSCMIIGRLEVMPIFVLMSPSIWKKR